MAVIAPNTRQWSGQDIITRTCSLHEASVLSPPTTTFPFGLPPGRRSTVFSFLFSLKCLYALSLHPRFTTPRCRPLSSRISSCPIFFPSLGSHTLFFLSSSSSSDSSLLLILPKVPLRVPRKTFSLAAEPQREPHPLPPASPGTWLSQPTSSSQIPSMGL